MYSLIKMIIIGFLLYDNHTLKYFLMNVFQKKWNLKKRVAIRVQHLLVSDYFLRE